MRAHFPWLAPHGNKNTSRGSHRQPIQMSNTSFEVAGLLCKSTVFLTSPASHSQSTKPAEGGPAMPDNCFFYSSRPLEGDLFTFLQPLLPAWLRKHVDGTWWTVQGPGDLRRAEHGNHTRLSVTKLAHSASLGGNSDDPVTQSLCATCPPATPDPGANRVGGFLPPLETITTNKQAPQNKFPPHRRPNHCQR